MDIRIHDPSWTDTAVIFKVSNLAPDDTYYYTVNDSTGRQIHAGQISGAGAQRDVDIMPAIKDKPAGSYEFRVYEAAEFDDEKDRPTADARPATRVFRFVPAPPPPGPSPRPPTIVRLDRGASVPTTDDALSALVLAATSARSFATYRAEVDRQVCRAPSGVFAPDAYRRLRRVTAEFLGRVRGPVVDPGGVLAAYLTAGKILPYVDTIAQRFSDANSGNPSSDLDPDLLAQPFPVELIWSYWEEEAGLVQALNLILARFQNRRVGRGPDPLARFDLSPLRPLRHILWGWVENEISQLTVRRRAAEYEFEYGLPLVGRAVPGPGHLVERRDRFLEAFHTLLYEAHAFFTLDDNTTVNADAFQVYNALRDTHLVLAEGASNQFGDLPTQARIEMLIMQWTLSQPEIRDYLGGKPMVPYDEPWMDKLDTMKSLYGWSPTSVTHFHDLAVRGERLLLTVRWGNWNGPDVTAESAKNWARTWRNDIQRYIHAYRAATGADLTAAPDPRPPALLLSRRLTAQDRRF